MRGSFATAIRLAMEDPAAPDQPATPDLRSAIRRFAFSIAFISVVVCS
ncbi:hypothetical protein [Tistrella sp.]|nr:hypothetical protein [Tistrella sp.]|tara:strand:- start:778 stop:921 length:144 start_codon:yes stop_codon:yes gene_type:complete